MVKKPNSDASDHEESRKMGLRWLWDRLILTGRSDTLTAGAQVLVVFLVVVFRWIDRIAEKHQKGKAYEPDTYC